MNMTFEYWTEEWFKSAKNEVRSNTLQEYYKVKEQLTEAFNDLAITDITPKRVQDLLDDMYAQGRAKSTINKRKYMIQQIIRFANVQGVELSNPCSFVKAPRLSTVTKRRALTQDEIANVMLHRNYEHCGFVAFCLLYTGTRRSELLALQWEDINFTDKNIHICKTVNFINNQPKLEHTLKNGNKERFVPMPRVLLSEMKKRMPAKGGFIFTNQRGRLPNETEHTRAWNRYKEETKLDVTQHMFRHTYATMLFDAKIDVKTAAYILGHNDIRTTLSIYTHLEKERAAKDAGQLLDRYINGF